MKPLHNQWKRSSFVIYHESRSGRHGDGCCYTSDNRANTQPPVMSAYPLCSCLTLVTFAPGRTEAECKQLVAKRWHSLIDGHSSSWIFPGSSVLTTASCCQELIGSVNSIPFAMTIWWNATSDRVWRNSKSLQECLLVCCLTNPLCNIRCFLGGFAPFFLFALFVSVSDHWKMWPAALLQEQHNPRQPRVDVTGWFQSRRWLAGCRHSALLRIRKLISTCQTAPTSGLQVSNIV